MRISARIDNQRDRQDVRVATGDDSRALSIPPKATGPGSSVNGGELLFLALATCYCNDIYREATVRDIEVSRVEVEVEGEFDGPGEPARRIVYRARVTSRADPSAIRSLMTDTDRVAEIQNTVRGATAVTLEEAVAESVPADGR